MNRGPLHYESGLTLVELLIAIAILGILTAVSISNFTSWLEANRINAEAQKVYFDLMLAKTSAVKNNNNVIVAFDSSSNTYQIHDDSNSDGVEDAGETIKSVALENGMGFGFNPSLLDVDGNVLSSAISLEGGSTVTFTPRGEASSSGGVYVIPLVDMGKDNSRMRAISIVGATGGLELLKYSDSVSPPWS